MNCICVINLIFGVVQAEVTLRFLGNVEIAPPGKTDSGNINNNNARKSMNLYQPIARATANYQSEDERDPEVTFKDGDMNMFPEKRKVKDDVQFRNFIVHVYKQHLKVFKKIKRKVTPDLHDEVEKLTNDFRAKFIEFVNNTQNYNIKTRHASQKIVMNTINTSNGLMKRLLDNLIDTLKRKRSLRIAGNDMVGIFKRKVVEAKESEVEHACEKLGVCTTDDGFSQFVYNIISEILKSDDSKIIQARDAFTEVLKDEDFTTIMDTQTLKKFRVGVNTWELAKAQELRAMLGIIKNIIHNKYIPITVPSSAGVKISSISRTVGILELLDGLDEIIPSTSKNKMKFEDINNTIIQWARDERKDIQEIMKSFMKIVQKGIKKGKAATVAAISDSLSNIVV